MGCNGMGCNGVQWDAKRCNGMQWGVTGCKAMQCDAMGCNGMQSDAMGCNGMQWGGMWGRPPGSQGQLPWGAHWGPYSGSFPRPVPAVGRCVWAPGGLAALRAPPAPGGSRRAHTAALGPGLTAGCPWGSRGVPVGLQPVGDVWGGCGITHGHIHVLACSHPCKCMHTPVHAHAHTHAQPKACVSRCPRVHLLAIMHAHVRAWHTMKTCTQPRVQPPPTHTHTHTHTHTPARLQCTHTKAHDCTLVWVRGLGLGPWVVGYGLGLGLGLWVTAHGLGLGLWVMG